MLSRRLFWEIKKRSRGLWYRPRIETFEERILLATDTWTGLGGTANWSNPANWDTGRVPQNGDDLVLDSSTNDLTPGMTFHSLIFTHGGTIQGKAVILTGGIENPGTATNVFAYIGLDRITLAADQTFGSRVDVQGTVDQNGFTLSVDIAIFHGPFSANGRVVGVSFGGDFYGPITLTGPATFLSSIGIAGPVNLNGFNLAFPGDDNGMSVYSNGVVSVEGNGSIIKDGSGKLLIQGVNTLTGPIIVNNGTLSAQGVITAPVDVVQGTLEADIPIPNYGVDQTGPTLNAGTLTFNSGTTFQVVLHGENPGTDATGRFGYAQVFTDEPVDLNGVALNVLVNAPFIPSTGSTFAILQSARGISGNFNGLPDGASLTLAGQTFIIHYYNSTANFPGEVVLSNDPRVTQTIVTSSQPTSNFSSPPTLTAVVANVGVSAVNGAPAPASGTVTFMDGPTALGDPIPLVNGPATLTPLLTAGTHSITAVFNPSDSSFLPSTSSPVSQVINPVDMGWHDVVTGDFLGNGKQDIAGMTATGDWWMAVSNGTSFTNQLWGHWSNAVTWVDVQTGDFDGDGKTDIVGRVAQTGEWWVAQSTGSSFTNSSWGSWSASPGVTWVDVKVGDFNGDGKSDITGRWAQAGQWWTAISNGSAFTTTLWATWAPIAWEDVKVGNFSGGTKAGITGRYGDGGQWWMGISTGTSFMTSLWATWAPDGPNVTWADVQVGDFNGDGMADITGRWAQAGQWWTGISTGTSFMTSLWATWAPDGPNVTWADVQVGDFNGDGKADITGRWLQGGEWWTAISTGSSFVTGLWDTWSPAATWVDVQVGDFAGSGKADLTGRYREGGQWWTATSSGSNFTNALWTTWPV